MGRSGSQNTAGKGLVGLSSTVGARRLALTLSVGCPHGGTGNKKSKRNRKRLCFPPLRLACNPAYPEKSDPSSALQREQKKMQESTARTSRAVAVTHSGRKRVFHSVL